MVRIAGGAEKGHWLTGHLGFDCGGRLQAGRRVQKRCARPPPRGVDVYFDNVGGDITHEAMPTANELPARPHRLLRRDLAI